MLLSFSPRAVFLLAALSVTAAHAQSFLPDAPNVDARHYILQDASSGQILAAHEADIPTPPASITKLMTAYLTFESLSGGTLKLNQQIPVSVAAWKAGGSTMFLQPGLPATVEQMISGMVVVSGNDAAVALSEAIAGNMDSFVQMMNATAGKIGMTHSHFDNVDGLPTPTHLVSAKDIAILTDKIIHQYPQYLHFFGQHTFTYNKVTQNNWNPLIFSDPTVTGMKTGHTEEAGFCLDAVATRNGHTLIAVVLGASTRKASAQGAEALLDYGYRFFETHLAYKAGQVIKIVKNEKAHPAYIPLGVSSDVWVTVPIGSYALLKPDLNINPLSLPLKNGQAVGRLMIGDGKKTIVEAPLVSLIDVEQANWLEHLWNMFKALIGLL
jgi:D-alanyl-D-alanine carboxypeptidase (penicillin-binding protein 5/6)